jgi:hypothetical protein
MQNEHDDGVDQATTIYMRLREVARLFGVAKLETEWLALVTRSRHAWDRDHPNAPRQRLLSGEEMDVVRASLEDAVKLILAIRANLSVDDLNPLRETVRAAKGQLGAIETLVESVP